MAQLTWRNVDAPNLAGAANILQNAVAGFSEAGKGIQETLHGVRERQRMDRSAAALPMLAGINSGANVDDVLARVNGAIRPEDMTPELQQSMLAARGLGLGYDSTRASTNSVNDANNRQQTTFDRGIARENQLAGMAPDLLRAQQGAYNTANQTPGQATAGILREFEGFSPTAYYDVNADRAGYGSDTVTRADGSVVPVKSDTTVSREDAERDLSRRVETEFLPRVMSQVGAGAFNNLNTQQQGVLGSVAYNYGSLPDSLVKAVQTGDQQAIAQSILNLSGDNDGVNAKRRSREAQMFISSVNNNYVPDIAGMLPKSGNTLLPEDLMGMVDNMYGDRRTAITNDRADLTYQLGEDQRIQEKTLADTAKANATEAKTRLESMFSDDFGPLTTQADIASKIWRAKDITPELRDAMLGQAGAMFDARKSSLLPPTAVGRTTGSSMIDGYLARVADQETVGDPLLNSLTASGIIAGNPSDAPAAPSVDAGLPLAVPVAGAAADGTIPVAGAGTAPGTAAAVIGAAATGAPVATSSNPTTTSQGALAQQQTSMLSLLKGFLGDDQVKISNSAVEINKIVNEIHKQHPYIPQEAIVAMANNSLTEGTNLIGVGNDTLTVDKDQILQGLSPIDTKEKYLAYLEDQRALGTKRQEQQQLAGEFQKLRTDAEYWSQSASPKAKERLKTDTERMKAIEDTFSKYDKENTQKRQEEDPVYQAQLAKQAKEKADEEAQVKAGANSEANRRAIMAASDKPTTSGAVVDPKASSWDQFWSQNARDKDINTALDTMKMKVIKGSTTDMFGGLFLDQNQAKTRNENNSTRTAVAQWYNSDEANLFFQKNPDLLDQALSDPMSFYEDKVLGKKLKYSKETKTKPAPLPPAVTPDMSNPIDRILSQANRQLVEGNVRRR